MLVARLTVILQAFRQDGLQLRRHFHARPDSSHQTLARSHFIQHQPEREQVGPSVERLSQRLLRRHITSRSQHGARRCDRPAIVVRGAFQRAELSQAEIEDLGVASLGNENVGRLDVPVDDAPGVGGIERIRDLDSKRQQRVLLQRLPGDAMLQCRAFQILHDEESTTVLLAYVMNRTDVGVIQRRCGSRLASETIQGIRVASQFIRQKLESDRSLQPAVLGLVDHAHSAAAQLLDDAVMRDGLADQGLEDGLGCTLVLGQSQRGHVDSGILEETSHLPF